MGKLGNRFGELAEHLAIPNIMEKFIALGYYFSERGIIRYNEIVSSETGRIDAELDILLENDSYSIAVEVKVRPVQTDLIQHIHRLEILRRYKDRNGDKREICGAIAGVIMLENVRQAALSFGLYVIAQSGDTVKIEEPHQIRGW
ncbi:MAG: hypothetical protein LBU25_06755, partial [Treponema sp.]|jgi:hypothetical protein|nr:hypothetical protein [Treponema sp.]